VKQTPDIERTSIAQNPFTVVNLDGAAPAIIICDHASRHIPAGYGDLGLPQNELARHIAWDIGAGEVARRLASLLDAPAVLCGTSRLVIDCNRPFAAASSIPPSSDGVPIPGNAAIGATERQRRIDRYFCPYHGEISRQIQVRLKRGQTPTLISIHSFTPVMDGIQRPWHVGLLWDREQQPAAAIICELRRDPDLVVGENQPYEGANPRGYALDAHAADNGLPFAVFEIRQDLIHTAKGADRWARVLATALRPILAEYAGAL